MKDLEMVKEIAQQIKEIADECNESYKNTDYENGRLISLCDALKIIQDAVGQENLKDIGLDFDVDAKYL